MDNNNKNIDTHIESLIQDIRNQQTISHVGKWRKFFGDKQKIKRILYIIFGKIFAFFRGFKWLLKTILWVFRQNGRKCITKSPISHDNIHYGRRWRIVAFVIGVLVLVLGMIVGGIYLFSDKQSLAYYEFEMGGTSKIHTANLGNISDTQFDNQALNTPFVFDYIIKKGDSLINILAAYNVGNRTATINAMNKVFSSRFVKVGQKLTLGIIGGDTPYEMASVVSLKLEVDQEQLVSVVWDKDTNTYSQEIIKRKLTSITKQHSGDIDLSLYVAMNKAGINQQTISDFINLFSFDTDFQRDIYKSDTFDIIYQEFVGEDKKYAKSGDILVAELSTLGGNLKRYYYYIDNKGNADYYDHTGKSGRKALMKTPIEGARLSSGFGKRRHPILGYTKMHKGTDFAAPTGTPIFAAGDGVVERAGRWGSYGIYMRIRHNNAYKTAYAHMSGIARGVRRGTRIKQGQVIGYVGSTGRSTGPHLHYEVIRNGKHINSRTMKLPSGQQLKGADLVKFKEKIKPYLKNGI